jgi:uncharacterized protein (TIGR00266 family)
MTASAQLLSSLPSRQPPSSAAVGHQEAKELGRPINFDVQSKVEGGETQVVSIQLEKGQVLRAEAGNLIYMEQGIAMDTSTGGGLGKMFSRVLTGQNLMVTDFRMEGEGKGTVALGSRIPAKVLRLDLAEYGGSLVAQKGAFLAGSATVDITTEFTRKLAAGLFGGEGFILQRLSGEGEVFLSASGHLIRRELSPGETLRVSSGCVVAFAPSVSFDVQTIGGIKNVVFGGEGLFITTLTGPGTVWLSGLPFDRLVGEIGSRLPARGGGGGFIPIGMGGGGEGSTGAEGSPTSEGSMGATVAASSDVSPPPQLGAQTAEGLFGDAAPGPGEAIQSDMDFNSKQQLFEQHDHGFSEAPKDESDPWGDPSGATDALSDGEGETSPGGILGSMWDFYKRMSDD